MLTIVSGRFHSSLESEFLACIKKLKTQPLSPLLIVAPTARLVEHLQYLLATHNVSSLNIHFHTLSSAIDEVVAADTPLSKPLLSDSLFYDTLLKKILREDRFFPQMEDMAVPNGFPPAVRSTLRDLTDAGIHADNVDEAIQEEYLGKTVDLGSLRSLLNLYRSYLKNVRALPVFPRSELLMKSAEAAPSSPYLARFNEIIFYGFYDMTGLQVEFFQSVAKNHPTRLFFPFVPDDPAYTFSKRFRDTFLQTVPHQETVLDSYAEGRKPSAQVDLFNVSGFSDEAWAIAVQIRRLHEVEKIPFSEMAVIARSEDRLRESLPQVFREHLIPIRSAAKEPLSSRPHVYMASQLLEMMDREIQSVSDMDFQDFSDFRLPPGMTSFKRPAEWPDQASWDFYIERADELIRTYFVPSSEQSRSVWDLLLSGLKDLGAFEKICASVDRREFLETLFEKWNRMEIESEKNLNGVSLLYAEAARGLSFRVIFMIGIEEKVFPRLLREDPFLRDEARLAINNTLGHKIPQKTAALEEERELFQLFIDAATQVLSLSYRRTDEEGNVVGASPFLRAFAEAQGVDYNSIRSVPRPMLEKIKGTLPSLLIPTEVTIGLLAGGELEGALSYVKAIGGDDLALKRGLEVRGFLQTFEAPGSYDGLIGGKPLSVVFKEGCVSATALEDYGRCPFRYFAEHILDLKPLEDPSILEFLDVRERGTIIHDFLERFYDDLTIHGSQPLPSAFPVVVFEKAFEAKINSIPAGEVKLHPVMWEANKITLKEKLRRFIESDLSKTSEEHFRPVQFEKDFTGPLPPFPASLRWKGRLDRVDVKEGEIRVVDYKTGRNQGKKVSLESLRGQKCQAPIYLLIQKKIQPSSAESRFSFRYSYPMETEDRELDLSHEEWIENQNAILQTISAQIEQMKKGRFVMTPEEAVCSFCDVAQACRKNHAVSLFRSRQGEGAYFGELKERDFKSGKSKEKA